MSSDQPGVDDLLERLESVIGRLSGGTAALEDLVSGHEEATALVEEVAGRLAAIAPPAVPEP